jgi:hypothetical protein
LLISASSKRQLTRHRRVEKPTNSLNRYINLAIVSNPFTPEHDDE